MAFPLKGSTDHALGEEWLVQLVEGWHWCPLEGRRRKKAVAYEKGNLIFPKKEGVSGRQKKGGCSWESPRETGLILLCLKKMFSLCFVVHSISAFYCTL